MGSARRALVTSIGLMLLRRRLQRRGGAGAALALVGLELVGPRLFPLRRLLFLALALTIVGGIVAAAIWWWMRQDEPAPASAAPTATTERSPVEAT